MFRLSFTVTDNYLRGYVQDVPREEDSEHATLNYRRLGSTALIRSNCPQCLYDLWSHFRSYREGNLNATRGADPIGRIRFNHSNATDAQIHAFLNFSVVRNSLFPNFTLPVLADYLEEKDPKPYPLALEVARTIPELPLRRAKHERKPLKAYHTTPIKPPITIHNTLFENESHGINWLNNTIDIHAWLASEFRK